MNQKAVQTLKNEKYVAQMTTILEKRKVRGWYVLMPRSSLGAQRMGKKPPYFL